MKKTTYKNQLTLSSSLVFAVLAFVACGSKSSHHNASPKPTPPPQAKEVTPEKPEPKEEEAVDHGIEIALDRAASQEGDLRQISYTCNVATYSGSHNAPGDSTVLWGADGNSQCIAGYELPESNAVGTLNLFAGRKIEVPTEVKTSFSLDAEYEFLTRTADDAGYELAVAPEPLLGVGEAKDCSTMELAMYYAVTRPEGGYDLREARLGWQHKYDAIKGNFFWEMLPASGLPSPRWVQIGQADSFKVFFHCTWRNKTGFAVHAIDAK